MKLISIKPVSELEIAQVKDILRQSHCPNESLRNTFPRYSTIIGDIIFFDDVTEADVKAYEDFYEYEQYNPDTHASPPNLYFYFFLEEDNHEHSTTAT